MAEVKMSAIPVDVWGRVAAPSQPCKVDKLKVKRSPGGGFLLITVEQGEAFDVWLETWEEVEASVDGLKIEWEP